MLINGWRPALERWRSKVVGVTLFLAACGGASDSGKCNIYGQDIGQMYETYASNIAIVDGGGGGTPLLYASGGRTKQWYLIDEQGHIGPPIGRARSDYYVSWVGEWTHAAFAWESGFRVLRDRLVEYVVPDEPVEMRNYSSAGPPLPESFTITLPFEIRGEFYVVWTAQESLGPPETWIAGLGRLERDDRVVPLGQPFLRTTLVPNSFGFFLPGGGWDPDAGNFWIDHPDRKQVLKVSQDGNLLGAEPIVGDAPPLGNWVKLPSGIWVALSGGDWVTFTPTERWLDVSHQNTVPASTTPSSTQTLDTQGTLWIAGTAAQQVSIRRYYDATSTLAVSSQSPLSIQDCGLLLKVD